MGEAGDVEAALALDRVDARGAYERALELVHSDAERRFLERRLAELNGTKKDAGPEGPASHF